MDNFIFDLQRFDEVTISAGKTYTLDGVTYTAVADAQLNLNDSGKISGIASGKVTAVISGAATSPTVTFDATDSAIKFTATGNGEILTVTAPFPIEFSKGEFTYKGNTLDISAGSAIAIVSERDGYTLRNEIFYEYGSGGTYTFTDTAFTAEGGRTRVLYTFTNGDDTRKLEMEGYGKTITNYAGQGFTLVKGSSDAITIGGYTLKATAVEDAGVNIYLSAEGLVLIPNKGDGALNVVLSRGDTEIISGELECTSGTITLGYDHAVTLDKDTSFNLTLNNYVLTVAATDKATTAIALTDNGITFTPNANDGGLNLVLSKDGTAVFGGNLNVTDGTITFDSTTQKFSFTKGTKVLLALENSQEIDFEVVNGNASFKVAADAGGNFTITPDENDGSIDVTLKQNGTAVFKNNFSVSNGSIILNPQARSLTLTNGTTVSFTQNEQIVTLTATENISATYKVEEEIYYLMLNGSSTANISVKRDGQTVLEGNLETGGVLSYRPETGTFGLTGANSSHGDGTNTFAQLTIDGQNGTYDIRAATNDTTLVFIPEFTADGKLNINFPNERKHAMKFTLSKDGQTTFEGNVLVDGKISLDTAAQEISLIKDTVITLVQGDNQLEITALKDAGGKLTFEMNGLRFAPNAGDGALELNFVAAERKATIDITGAIILGEDNKISLEDGTEVNFAWEDGAKLKLTSTGSTGSIALDEKGIKITSDDENLSIDLTTATGDQTQLKGIKGTIYYNGGTVSFDENSTITATSTLGGEPVLTTLETINGTGHIEFASNGVIYSADTGAMKVTWKKEDVESTFVVNSGSVQIGHGLFQITEGTDLATDLKDFIPALNFTTSEAGTYTINGQTIKTTAKNISMTATDDYMTFVTSDDVVTYNGMTFAGAGKVSLSPDNVVLGAGVEATGFGEGNSFVLAEAGNVTADAKIFELSKIEGTPREIPMIITVTGAQDGFIFSRTLTKESEAYLDDALDDEKFENYTSPYIDKVFTEKFISAGDSSYRIRTDAIGLQEVIGISDGATVTGGAILGDEPTLSYFNLVTDTDGSFTIGEKTYNVSGDSSVAIRARFEADTAPYASYFDSLNGTVSGDFTGGEFSINGSSGLQVSGDSAIDIVADENGFEIFGLDEGASLKVSAADTYTVNGTALNADAKDFIIGGENNDAYILSADDAEGQKFENYTADTLITATDGDDTILSNGANVTIKARGGNDTIANGGDFAFNNVSINAGGGNDFIFNDHSYYTTLEGGNGDDKIVVTRGHYTNIDGGAGNDTILGDTVGGWAMGGYAVIDGGAGNDYIDPIESDSASIYGGAGNDTIITSGNDATINGGADDDLISLHGDSVDNNVIKYESGGGNDTIYGLNETSVISLTSGAEYSSVESGDDVIVTVGENKITVAGGASLFAFNVINYELTALDVDNSVNNTLITGTKLDDSIANSGDNVTINGAAGNDSIDSEGDNVSINGGAGNDSIDNTGNYATIEGAEGDDYLVNWSSDVSISGSYGNDTIKSYDSNVTIKPGGGHDLVVNTFGKNVLIDYEGGNDTIWGLNENSTLQIGGGSGEYETLEGITNVLVFNGENIVVLKEALLRTDTININSDSIELSKVIELTLNDEDVPIIRDNVSVNGGAGNDTITNYGKNVTIDGATGDDYISLNSGAALVKYAAGDGDDSISGFNANSTLSIAGGKYSSAKSGDDLILTVGENTITLEDAATLTSPNVIGTVTAEITTEEIIESLIGSDSEEIVTLTGGGTQDINLSKEDYDVAVVEASATGRKNISLGGGDLAVVEETSAKVSVTASKGNDTIVSRGENVLISLRGGKTDIFAQEGKMKIAGYNVSTGSGFHTDYEDIFTAIKDGEIFPDKGNLTIGSAVIVDGDGNNLVNLYNADGKLQKVGVVPQYESLNLSKEKADWILTANENSTLTSGTGNDSIFVFAGSHVDAGVGKNYIYVKDRDKNDDGATIVLSSGRNTIENFKTGFEDTSDRLFFGVNDTVDLKFDGTNVSVRTNDELRGILTDIADDEPFVNILTEDNNSTPKVVVAQKGATITVDDELADFYSGDKSAVDFTSYEGTLMADLGSEKQSVVAGEVLFSGINQITAGEGQSTLIGSTGKETLTAGIGGTSIWGGAGNDVLQGTTSENKDGATEFFFNAGDGNDVVKDFEFLTDDNAATADKINVDSAVTDVVLNSAGNVRLQVGGGDDWLTLENAQGKNFKINDFVAKVDSDIEFDDATNYYVAAAKNATLTVSDSVENNAVIWLGNSERNGSHFIGNIKTIDASDATVKTELAGNDLSNTILAGQNDASLWGGNGGDDSLIGGEGVNMFFYTNGNGNDTLEGINDGDCVYLSSVTLSDLVSTEFKDSSIAINFKDGGKLTVKDDGAAVGIVLEDTTYYVNDERNDYTTTKPE